MAEKAVADLAVEALKAEPRFAPLISEALQATGQRRDLPPYRLPADRTRELAALAERLGLQNKSSLALLDLALTHRSYVLSNPNTRPYDQLAFLGGAYVSQLALLVTEMRDSSWQWSKERDSRWRDLHQAQTEACVQAFSSLELDDFLRVGEGQMRNTGIENSMRADVIQALLAVAFLWEGIESGVEKWKRWVRIHVLDRVESQGDRDAVSALQEFTTENYGEFPTYSVVPHRSSTDSKPRFIATCILRGEPIAQGEGRSKRLARKIAARKAASTLGVF